MQLVDLRTTHEREKADFEARLQWYSENQEIVNKNDELIKAQDAKVRGRRQRLHMCPHSATYVSSYCCICVRILLHMRPHAATYVSSYCYVCVRILVDVSSYCCICVLILFICVLLVRVLILLHMCPHTAVYVS